VLRHREAGGTVKAKAHFRSFAMFRAGVIGCVGEGDVLLAEIRCGGNSSGAADRYAILSDAWIFS
jgi:hypothetical protein